MSVCLSVVSVAFSVRPSGSLGQLGFLCTDFDKIWYLRFFQKKKIVEKIHVLLKSDKNNWYFP